MGPAFFPLFICVALAFSPASSEDRQCKENYKLFKDSCYFPSSDKATWNNAQKECKSHGGNLVSIHSDEENNFVASLSQNWVWIGGYENPKIRVNSMNWRWIDGQLMDYLNWDAGQPRDYQMKMTMMMGSDGTWINENPTEEAYYVCKHESVPTCDTGYSEYNSYCYSYRDGKLGFHHAQKNCSDEGGNLASVHSLMESFFLITLTGHHYTWIGGKRDPANDEFWMWTDNTTFKYKDWAIDQPAGNPDNDCILMNYHSKWFHFGWTNELCDIAYGYICKKPKRPAL